MQYSLCSVRALHRILLCACAASLLLPGCFAQQPTAPKKGQKLESPHTEQPRPPARPALIDPAGPAVSLETSEAMFDIGVALNACGYDDGLTQSDPIRAKVRAQVNQATEQSAAARDARDKLCTFVDQHRLADAGRSLAQYVSLALFLSPPPALAPSTDQADMPPDSTQVIDILPLLRTFAQATQLHLIWVANHPAYEQEVNELHDPLTNMIVKTNTYLKMPASTYNGSRFLVVLAPMLSPRETNARVYGSDYVVVASPVNGKIDMQDVRHTYLHYEIEPVLYARTTAMDRLLPLLKTVRDAPLDWRYKDDIVSLVVECMIRAIEARTMDTGIPEYKVPADADRSDLPHYTHLRNLYLQQVAAVKQKRVDQDMTDGYVLTQYFYNQMISFEHSPTSLKEAIGPMVYGMDVEQQVSRAKHIDFAEQGTEDVVARAPTRPNRLEQAEMKVMQGDATGASKLAQQALKDHTEDADRAYFILARASLMKGDMDSAEKDFDQTIQLSKDPRMLAWSHIYLGQIDDVKQERDQALVEYQTALKERDGQPDTKRAAEKGLKQPFAPPHQQTSSGATSPQN